MKITIKTLCGKIFLVDVAPCDSIKSIKAKIEEEQGMSAHHQFLVYGGTKLEDEKMIGDYNIHEKSIIYMHIPMEGFIHIFIKILKFKIIMLEAKPDDIVGKVKAKIQQKEGICADHQRLIFTGIILDDNKSLCHYNIQEKAMLQLVIHGSMTITVKTLDNKIIPLEVDASDTIDRVKKLIEETEGIVRERQRLIYGGKMLQNTETLANHNVKKQSMLYLILRSPEGIDIIIKTLTGYIRLEVQSTDTIEEVKSKIYLQEGIPPYHQRLVFEGAELENEQLLVFYKIKNESIVNLVMINDVRMIIYIKHMCGRTLILEVEPFHTIENVKEIIEDTEDIPVRQQRLFSIERQIVDKKTLYEQKIRAESTLYMILDRGEFIRIFIKIFTGKTVTLFVKPSETVRELKLTVEAEVAAAAERLQLVYIGRELQDFKILSDYNIQEDSTIHLTLRLR